MSFSRSGVFLTSCLLSLTAGFGRAAPLPPMLDLPGSGGEVTKIDFARLPVLRGEHAVVSKADSPWGFRLHNYLAFHDGRFWCMWSHGTAREDELGAPGSHGCVRMSNQAAADLAEIVKEGDPVWIGPRCNT